jgi:NAD(P)-dependent dehydrogenase (short-subunit alcohol dehydrogenase family)
MRYAVATGGARGLGLGIVRALLTDNVAEQVAVIDRELAPPPTELAGRVEGFGTDVRIEHDRVLLCNTAGVGEADWFHAGRWTE